MYVCLYTGMYITWKWVSGASTILVYTGGHLLSDLVNVTPAILTSAVFWRTFQFGQLLQITALMETNTWIQVQQAGKWAATVPTLIYKASSSSSAVVVHVSPQFLVAGVSDQFYWNLTFTIAAVRSIAEEKSSNQNSCGQLRITAFMAYSTNYSETWTVIKTEWKEMEGFLMLLPNAKSELGIR